MSDEKDQSVLNAWLAKADSRELLRLYARGGSTPGCYVLGEWAVRIAKDYIKSAAVVKYWSSSMGGDVPVVTVNDVMAKEIIRDCLLRFGVSVEFLERPPGGGAYVCVQRGSPGNIADFEASLFEFGESEIQLMSFGAVVLQPVDASTGGSEKCKIGFAALNTTLRVLSFAEFVDSVQLCNLDALIAQCNLKEILCVASTQQIAEEDGPVKTLQRICSRGNVIMSTVESGARQGSSRSNSTGNLTPPVSGSPKSGDETPRLTPSGVLCRLEDLLRVPEEKVSLMALPLATKATELLLQSIDLSDSTNLRAFYLKHIIPSTFMQLDRAAVDALTIVSSQPEPRGTLPKSIFTWLNRCSTGMGSRTMRQWLLQPLRSVDDIDDRLTIVEVLCESPVLRDSLRQDVLRRCSDMDRLNRKLQRRCLSLKDTQSFLSFIGTLPIAIRCLRTYRGQACKLLTDEFIAPLEDINEHMGNLRTLIEATVDFSDRGDPRIMPEFDDDLLDLDKQRSEVLNAIDKEYHNALRKYDWNEKQLKCEHHQSYGYVFRVSRKDDRQVRSSKELITLATAKDGVRFVSEKLAALSEQYSAVAREYHARQADLKEKLVETIASYLPVLDDAKELIARLDVFVAWSVVVKESHRPLVRPKVLAAPDPEDKETVISLVNARHPLVELREGDFVANSVRLTQTQNAMIITGPNMGGKSTFMRSVGICTVLAQAGCFVPADAATVVVRDAVMCRVGATDHVAQGLSTFMVEMLESAAILSSATSQTLAIVDELGRGTSTYDGFGLAWAIAEEIATKVHATLLFSTHFHEMTALPTHYHNRTISNWHFGAETTSDGRSVLRFSYKLQPGASGRSYGLYVAELAQMPQEVIEMAKVKAAELETFDDQQNWDAVSEECRNKLASYAKRVRELETHIKAVKSEEPVVEEEEEERSRAVKALRSEIASDPSMTSLLASVTRA